jgi:hypothetical protein
MRVGGDPQQDIATSAGNSYGLETRRGPKKAVLAVAASILTAAYYLLRNQEPYRDLGTHYFAGLDQDRTAQRLVRRIKQLGYEVEIHKAQAADSQGAGRRQCKIGLGGVGRYRSRIL